MSRTPFPVSLLALLFVFASAFRASSQTTRDDSGITESLRRDVQFLASDDLRGRNVTDESIDVARDYLRDRMSKIGLDLKSVDGSPFQPVKIAVGTEIRTAEGNFCRFQLGDRAPLETGIGSGFGPLTVGKDQAKAAGRVIFAGFGITSRKHAYDDYASVDAEGAIVMMLRKEPGSSDPDSPFDGVKNTRHAYFATKIANAIEQGAAAVLMINDAKSTREAAQKEQNRIDNEVRRRDALQELLEKLPEAAAKNRAAAEERIVGVQNMIEGLQKDLESANRGVLGVSDAGPKSEETGKIPVASIARDVADEILSTIAGKSLESIEAKINSRFQPDSYSLEGATADLSVDLKPAVAVSDNVIGRLPGRGLLANQAIVVGAHYDHVGMGGFASLAPGTIAVHNGADDNASGTATMLACGELLQERLSSVATHRTVLFIGFTGEERGLVGSQHYVKNPVFPIGQTAAMINLDMVGRLRDNELTVYGTGSASRLDGIVEAANRPFGFDLFKVASGYGPSDHQSFYRARVPVLFFFTGLHNDYHRPSDDFDKIDFGNLTRVTDMVSEVAYRLAVLPQRPSYAETDPRVQIRRQMTAYLGVRVSQRRGGIVITEVTEGGPASKAGLRVDDQIQRIGQKAIQSTNDVLSWVRAHPPGHEFTIEVRRNTKPITLRGKLEKRSEK